MRFGELTRGTFVSRDNRFVVTARIGDSNERVHLPNTGRLKELMIPGTPVLLSEANGTRKTRYTLKLIGYNSGWVCLDTGVTNSVLEEWVERGNLDGCHEPEGIRREVRFGNSRFDLWCRDDAAEHYVEAKCCTLIQSGTALFPDAPSERAHKHLTELTEMVNLGMQTHVVFLIQQSGANHFEPNKHRDPVFAKLLSNAAQHGVRIQAVQCMITPESIEADHEIPVVLDL